jgi:hypothetical protein
VTATGLEFQRQWLRIPKIVFSSTLDSVDWNSRLVRGDVGDELARLREEFDGDFEVGGAPSRRSSSGEGSSTGSSRGHPPGDHSGRGRRTSPPRRADPATAHRLTAFACGVTYRGYAVDRKGGGSALGVDPAQALFHRGHHHRAQLRRLVEHIVELAWRDGHDDRVLDRANRRRARSTIDRRDLPKKPPRPIVSTVRPPRSIR